jgi:hypothetical protein
MPTVLSSVAPEAVEAEWEAGLPPARRTRLMLGTGLPALVVTLIGMLGPIFVDVQWLPNLILLGGLWLLFSTVFVNPRTFRVTADGLARRGRILRWVAPWDTFEGVAVTDEALVFERTDWWRPTVHCALGDVEDADAVLAALDAHLDRA